MNNGVVIALLSFQVGAEAAGAVRAEHPAADARVQGGPPPRRHRAAEVHLPRQGRNSMDF